MDFDFFASLSNLPYREAKIKIRERGPDEESSAGEKMSKALYSVSEKERAEP